MQNVSEYMLVLAVGLCLVYYVYDRKGAQDNRFGISDVRLSPNVRLAEKKHVIKSHLH